MEFSVVAGIVLLIALGVGIFLYDHMYKRLTQKNTDLTHKKNLIEMEAKAFSSQMNPHFIYNSLSTAQYLIMTNENDKAFNYLSDFSLLLRQMFENAKKSHVQLNDEIEFIKRYIELEKLRFNNSFTCKLDLPQIADAKNFKIPTMMIQPVVENAIRHGLAPKKQDGELNITLNLNEEYLLCKIEDNGNGLKKELHETPALNIIKERLRLINALDIKNGDMIITNKANGNNKSGVIVELILPFIENT